jgi:hypothetical protein
MRKIRTMREIADDMAKVGDDAEKYNRLVTEAYEVDKIEYEHNAALGIFPMDRRSVKAREHLARLKAERDERGFGSKD